MPEVASPQNHWGQAILTGGSEMHLLKTWTLEIAFQTNVGSTIATWGLTLPWVDTGLNEAVSAGYLISLKHAGHLRKVIVIE